VSHTLFKRTFTPESGSRKILRTTIIVEGNCAYLVIPQSAQLIDQVHP
jgi:hypothetical protein